MTEPASPNHDEDEPYDMVLLDKTSKETHRLASAIYLLSFLLGSFALNHLYLRLAVDHLTTVPRISFFYMGILSLPFLGALHGFYVYVYLAKDPAWEKHHEHFNTITVSAIYAHPLEFVIGNSLPVFAVLFILKSRMHVVTLSTWLNLRLLSTHAGHSGYEMPLSLYKVLPNTTTGIYHCYHHIKNAGNYGSTFGFWDKFFGTSTPYDKEQKLREDLLSQKVKID